jgi:hypothetical protein
MEDTYFVLGANKKIMSFHRSGSNGRKRKSEYIPEEKYDVDGTLIKNEEAFKKKRWDFKGIVRRNIKSRLNFSVFMHLGRYMTRSNIEKP